MIRSRILLAAVATLTAAAGASAVKAASIGATLHAAPGNVNEGGTTAFTVDLLATPSNNWTFLSYTSVSGTFSSGSLESNPLSQSFSAGSHAGTAYNGISVGSFTYYQNGTFSPSISGTVSASERNPGNQLKSTSANFSATFGNAVNVSNIPTTLAIDSLNFDFFLTEGATGNYGITFTDPGHDGHTVEWDFDYNGVTFSPEFTQTIAAGTAVGSTSGSSAASHTFNTAGTFLGAVRIFDGNDYTLSTFSVNVEGVQVGAGAPVAAVPAPAALGGGVALLAGLAVSRRRAK